MSSSRNPLAVLRSLPCDGSCDDVRDGALREAGLQRAARRLASPAPPSPPDAEPGAGLDQEVAPALWSLPELSGRLSELCADAAGASLTLAFALVLDAQRRAEPVAWLMDEQGGFFPPDAAEGGVDLDALLVVRARDLSSMASAADQLARSGAFGLLVVDLMGGMGGMGALPGGSTSSGTPGNTASRGWGWRRGTSFGGDPVMARLLGLAQKHDAAVIFLTEAARAPSLGSLISLRAEARREELRDGSGYACELSVVKDKRRGPGWCHREVCRGPAGLR